MRIFCFSYTLYFQHREVDAHYPYTTIGVWTHSVINFMGLDELEGDGFSLYNDGIRNIAIAARYQRNFGPTNGRIAVGRRYTENNANDDYTSFEADELFFFNRTLTDTEIRILSQTA